MMLKRGGLGETNNLIKLFISLIKVQQKKNEVNFAKG